MSNFFSRRNGQFLPPVANVLLTTGLFTLMDALYLGFLRRQHHVDYFRTTINRGTPFARSHFLVLALLVWSLLGLGIESFVLPHSLSVSDAVLKGGLFGFIVYGVYDLTNLATINTWTVPFSVQDIIWGTASSATVAGIRKVLQK